MAKETEFINADPDTIMTEEEAERFKKSMKELKEGKTTPLGEVKDELGL